MKKTRLSPFTSEMFGWDEKKLAEHYLFDEIAQLGRALLRPERNYYQQHGDYREEIKEKLTILLKAGIRRIQFERGTSAQKALAGTSRKTCGNSKGRGKKSA